jgi:2-polyprenyl-6-hydroxyphenyl methylase/3-demethylubiquinone-9 3-methyltransferase
MITAYSTEVKAGKRFQFGKNWQRFHKRLNAERIAEAEKSLREFLEVEDLRGQSFLDIGSGSGLFSLAARKMGANVVAFDFDPHSVECTKELKRRYFGNDKHWEILQGSVLDRLFLANLGQFDVVYAWGVLHHTGAMWEAMENVKSSTKPGGKLFIAIYNDCGNISRFWMDKKIRYNRLPGFLKLPYAVWTWAPIEWRSIRQHRRAGRLDDYFRQWTEYKKSRGMSRWHDMIDWIGGYPYEFAHLQSLLDFYESENFRLCKIAPNTGYGCHQLVFQRKE